MRSFFRRTFSFELRRKLKRLAWLPVDIFETRGALVPPRGLRLVGDGDYQEIGKGMLEILIGVGGLSPNDRVLDVGCGTGRIAAPMTGFLKASYTGFDIVKSEIDWATAHISRSFPNFSFLHSDIFNGHYNPKGEFSASAWPFPFTEASFDFAIASSVFTHMVPKSVVHYLSEIGRVLSPGGVCFATAFMLDPVSLDLLQAGHSRVKFSHREGPTILLDRDIPEIAIAYDKDYLYKIVENAGLQIKDVRYGYWSGRKDGYGFHDILMLTTASKTG
jgi:SAM-dependent methyltransferase